MELDLGLVASGFLVGAVVGVTGVGGGSLMTPTLIGFFGVPPLTAVGTDLAFASITKTAGVAAHHTAGRIDWRIARQMMIGSLPACVIALAILHFAPLSSTAWLATVRVTIACSLVLTALGVLLRERFRQLVSKFPIDGRPLQTILTISGAAAIGALVAISSIGAGAIGGTVIALLHPKLDAREIAATDLAYAVPLTAIAALGHALGGRVDGGLLVALLIGSVPGILVGARLCAYIRETWVRAALAVSLLMAAVKMFA